LYQEEVFKVKGRERKPFEGLKVDEARKMNLRKEGR